MQQEEILFAKMVYSFRHIGFGRMMQIISHIWWNEDHNGALMTGECYATAIRGKREQQTIAEFIRADLKRLEVE